MRKIDIKKHIAAAAVENSRQRVFKGNKKSTLHEQHPKKGKYAISSSNKEKKEREKKTLFHHWGKIPL